MNNALKENELNMQNCCENIEKHTIFSNMNNFKNFSLKNIENQIDSRSLELKSVYLSV